MTKVRNYLAAVFNSRSAYLNLTIGVLVYMAIGYLVYLNLHSAMLQQNIATVVAASSANEGIHIVINFAQLYAAYALFRYRKCTDTKQGLIAFGLVLVSQAFFANALTFVMLFWYVRRFIGFRFWDAYHGARDERDAKMLLSAVVCFAAAAITFALRLKLGLWG